MNERTETEGTAPSTIDTVDVQDDTLSALRKIWDSCVAGLPDGHAAWRRGAAYIRDGSGGSSARGSASIQLGDTLDRLARRQILVPWEDVYFDDAPRTSFANRPSLQRLLAGVRSGRYSVIGAYRLDRIVRKPEDAEALRLELLRHGVELDCHGDLGADLLGMLVREGARWS
jgi:hypothetical protein